MCIKGGSVKGTQRLWGMGEMRNCIPEQWVITQINRSRRAEVLDDAKRRKTDMKRVGKKGGGRNGREEKKWNEIPKFIGGNAGWWFSMGTISSPVICPKMLWLSGQRNLRKLPAKILEYFPQTSTLFLNLKEYERRCYSFDQRI